MRLSALSICLFALAGAVASPAEAGEEAPATMQRFLLTDPGGVAENNSADIYLSAYRLNHPALKQLEAAGKLSPRRWVDVQDAVIYPGHGEGIATIDGMKFKVTYAWRGLTEWDIGVGRKNFRTVLGWTVRIESAEGGDIKKQMAQIHENILRDENGGRVTREIPMGRYLRTLGVKTFPQLRAKWIRDNAELVKRLAASDEPTMVELGKKIAASSNPEAIDKRIAELKGKRTIELPIGRVNTIEPWALKTAKTAKTRQARQTGAAGRK
jgi:hypothetical protein